MGFADIFSLDRRGRQSSRSGFQPLPEQSRLNQILLGVMENISRESQNLSPWLRPQPELYQPGGYEADILSRISDLSVDPRQSPITDELMRLGTGTGLQDAYKQLFETIIGPELANNATLSGLGGRGSSGYQEFANRYLASVAPTIMGQRAGFLGMVPSVQGQSLANMGIGAQAAGAGRAGALQDFLNRGQLASTALLGIPSTLR